MLAEEELEKGVPVLDSDECDAFDTEEEDVENVCPEENVRVSSALQAKISAIDLSVEERSPSARKLASEGRTPPKTSGGKIFRRLRKMNADCDV